MARGAQLGQVGAGALSELDFVVDRQVEAGARARHLVGQIDGAMLPQKIFVPAHAPVRSGFVAL
jgi:hypothetical protein